MNHLSPVEILILVFGLGPLALISLQEWRRRRKWEREQERYLNELSKLDDDVLAARVRECLPSSWASAFPAKVVERLQRTSGWTAFELQVTIQDVASALADQGGRSLFLTFDSGLGTLSEVVNKRVRQQNDDKTEPAETL